MGGRPLRRVARAARAPPPFERQARNPRQQHHTAGRKERGARPPRVEPLPQDLRPREPAERPERLRGAENPPLSPRPAPNPPAPAPAPRPHPFRAPPPP